MNLEREGKLGLNYKIDDIVYDKEARVRFLCNDTILLIEDAFNFGDKLIEVTSSKDHWKDATIANNYKHEAFIDQNIRSNSGLPLLGGLDENYAKFEEILRGLVDITLKVYRTHNDFIVVDEMSSLDLLRYEVGQEFKMHVDTIKGHAEFSKRVLSIIFYINDNYEGGELLFSKQNVKLKPKAGTILMFPSNFCYPHASLPVTKGTKYSAVSWLS